MHTRIESDVDEATHQEGRDQLAFMICGLWMVIGLYIDGWAHEADRPETFLTPWHGVLYSGFGAAVLYGLYAGRRDSRTGRASGTDDRIATVGIATFLIGAGGDAAWHELIGVEADLEALVSPTHLALLIGGLLMVTMPVRIATKAAGQLTRDAKLALLMSVGLALSVVTFFLMYLSPWAEVDSFLRRYVPEDEVANLALQTAMATVIVTSVLFCGALLWTARRWTLPFGTATATFTGVAVAQSGLEGFDLRLTILCAPIAGLVADVLLSRGRTLPLVGAATGAAFWASYFALLHAERGIEWGPSLWVGAIVFGALAGYGTGVAVNCERPAPAAAA